MNRKLIRTTLAEIKEREAQHKDHPAVEPNGGSVRAANGSAAANTNDGAAVRVPSGSAASSQSATVSGRKKQPAAETNAEVFYYKKQIESHTQMVIVLQDGEEIEGTIEWYDRSALKVNRRGSPNIMLLKHNVKYMFKAEDRDENSDESLDPES